MGSAYKCRGNLLIFAKSVLMVALFLLRPSDVHPRVVLETPSRCHLGQCRQQVRQKSEPYSLKTSNCPNPTRLLVLFIHHSLELVHLFLRFHSTASDLNLGRTNRGFDFLSDSIRPHLSQLVPVPFSLIFENMIIL